MIRIISALFLGLAFFVSIFWWLLRDEKDY